jgi:fructosamine-3-kinase
MLPSDVAPLVKPHLDGPIQDVRAVEGGCIANSSRIATEESVFFLKWGAAQVAETFLSEAAGLRAMRAADLSLRVPEVYHVQGTSDEGPGFILMEWIESGVKDPEFWEGFGRGLVELHRYVGDRYGFEEDNFIGGLPQINDWMDDWPTFFCRCRLEPQVRIAREKDRWSSRWNKHLDRLYSRIDGWLPGAPEPSLLHGDLWSGNVMADAAGNAALIDPAVYYGHREADLAMTELFGGFDARFYAMYRDAWPLEPGYEQRRDLYNLYHLMNHLNLFGKSYADSVETIMRRYG